MVRWWSQIVNHTNTVSLSPSYVPVPVQVSTPHLLRVRVPNSTCTCNPPSYLPCYYTTGPESDTLWVGISICHIIGTHYLHYCIGSALLLHCALSGEVVKCKERVYVPLGSLYVGTEICTARPAWPAQRTELGGQAPLSPTQRAGRRASGLLSCAAMPGCSPLHTG